MITSENVERQGMWATPFAGVMLDYIDNKALEKYILDFKKNTKSRDVSNEGGWQQSLPQDIHPVFNDLVKSIHIASKTFEIKPGPKKINLQMWVNVNDKGHWNNLHDHVGAEISGIYYVKVPKDSGHISFRDPRAITISEQSGENPKWVNIEPNQGVLMLFPGYLEHMVKPNQSDESRISIAFNLFIYDDKQLKSIL